MSAACLALLFGLAFAAADALLIDPGAIASTHFLPARLLPGVPEEISMEAPADWRQNQTASQERPVPEEAMIQSIALPEATVLGAAMRRNGTNSQGMNSTVMSEKNLPTMSRHVNGKTEVADWHHEYPEADLVQQSAQALPPVLRSPWTGALLVFFTLFAAAMVLLALGYLA
mmetsp:Transcript_51626/g.95569  ORF Transcript_51626/g.95569 Transcript_51626/m.95569 type:complete len:172 (+) Transcript_51626:130-645(+)